MGTEFRERVRRWLAGNNGGGERARNWLAGNYRRGRRLGNLARDIVCECMKYFLVSKISSCGVQVNDRTARRARQVNLVEVVSAIPSSVS